MMHACVQPLTVARFACHASVAVLMSVLYHDVGAAVDKSRDHTSALFFHSLIIMFAAMMPTVQTCALHLQLPYSYTLRDFTLLTRLEPRRAKPDLDY